MKICPQCRQQYSDESLNYCLNDGVKLETSGGEPETLIYPKSFPTEPQSPFNTVQTASQPTVAANQPSSNPPAPAKKSRGWLWALLILGGLVVLCGGAFLAVALKISNDVTTQINSIDFNAAANKFNINFNSSVDENGSPSNSNKSAANSNKKAAAVVSEDSQLSKSAYAKIKDGMTFEEVTEILGSEGEQVSSSAVGNYKTETYKWSGEDYSFVIVTFQNDKVMFKTQANLK